MRTIKLMADYGCWPLWEASSGPVGNIDPDELPISKGLKDRLKRWAADYDATLVVDDPASSGFATSEARSAFSAVGLRLGEDLEAELGSGARVIVTVPR
jgi:hypothetical protein